MNSDKILDILLWLGFIMAAIGFFMAFVSSLFSTQLMNYFGILYFVGVGVFCSFVFGCLIVSERERKNK